MIDINFRTGNDSFGDSPEIEAARILRELADSLENGLLDGPIRDSNGNTVGALHFNPQY